MVKSQKTKKNYLYYLVCCGLLFGLTAFLFLFPLTTTQTKAKRNVRLDKTISGESKQQQDVPPYCTVEELEYGSVLEHAIWVDEKSVSSNTLIPHPWSTDMATRLLKEIEDDPGDKARLQSVARRQLDTKGSACRLMEWNAHDFSSCLTQDAPRRLIFVGDSMTMQQAESLGYLLDMSAAWDWRDRSDEERQQGVCRHCIDGWTNDTKLQLMARGVFHTTEWDGAPMRFNKDAWDIMVRDDLGGWKEGDILVVNFGAHYMPTLLDFRKDLPILFQTLAQVIAAANVTVFWKDYAPAHFRNFADGEYPPGSEVKLPNERACGPHLMAPKTPSIVMEAVDEAIKQCGAPCEPIRRLRVWNLLRNAWDQHKEATWCWDATWCDCRHYLIPGPMDYANVLLYHQLCVDNTSRKKAEVETTLRDYLT